MIQNGDPGLPKNSLGTAANLVREAGTGAVRDFVWAEVQSGMMRLTGLNRSTRALVRLTFTLLALVVLAMLSGTVWREASPLHTVWSVGASGRGSLMPQALLPASLFLLSVAWSLVLAGARHSRPLIRWGALAVYAATVSPWIALGTTGAGTPNAAGLFLLAIRPDEFLKETAP